MDEQRVDIAAHTERGLHGWTADTKQHLHSAAIGRVNVFESRVWRVHLWIFFQYLAEGLHGKSKHVSGEYEPAIEHAAFDLLAATVPRGNDHRIGRGMLNGRACIGNEVLRSSLAGI